MNISDIQQQYQQQRLTKSRQNGNWINLMYDAGVPDSIKHSVNMAKSLWESKLNNAVPVYIFVEMAPLREDLASETTVGYCGDEMDGYPGALASQVIGEPMGTIEYPDAIITLNSSLEWNCKINPEQSQTFNVTTMALRGFARSFGFGSTIRKNELPLRDPYYYSGTISHFDKFILTERFPLFSYPLTRPDIINYIENGPLYISGKEINGSLTKYSLYTNKESFIPGLNLSTINDNTSLMYYAIGRGDNFPYVDNITISILNVIGWNFDQENKGCNIVFEDSEAYESTSIYPPQAFKLNHEDESQITSYAWTLFLPNANGEVVVAQQSEQSTFSIEPLDEPELYLIDDDNKIPAVIECKYDYNGEKYISKLENVNIELKPVILSIDNVTKLQDFENDSFGLTFSIKYRGTNRVEVYTETQYNPGISEYNFYGNCETVVNLPNYFDELLYNWAYIYVKNKYGSDNKTLEFAPGTNPYTTAGNIEQKMDCSALVSVYSLDGRCLFSGNNVSLNSKELKAGIYIKVTTLANGQIKQEKIIIQ